MYSSLLYLEVQKKLGELLDYIIWLLERDSNPWPLGYEPNEITTSLPSDITGDFNRIRTYNLLVNSQLLYHWAMKPFLARVLPLAESSLDLESWILLHKLNPYLVG